MLGLIVATACAGVFAGAAIYISAVEHPARLACGTEVALKEFAPSYHRATMMQASLAIVGCAAGLWAAWTLQDLSVTIGAVCLGAVVPFTLIVILPTNKRLLDPALDPRSPHAAILLVRWGRLHAIRSMLGALAFGLLVMQLSAR
jgi:hypothetical protein